jgi:hypothetical protein
LIEDRRTTPPDKSLLADARGRDCARRAADYHHRVSGILRALIGCAPAAVLAAAVVSAGAGGALAAAADPVAPELSLTWRAPAACPNAGDIEAQFARLLGGVHRQPTSKHLDATVTVRRTPSDNWVARLETRLDGVPGQRSLEGDSCWTVASAAALILALTIDPSAPNPPNAANAANAASPSNPAPPATAAPTGGSPPEATGLPPALRPPPSPSAAPASPPSRRPSADLTTTPGVSSTEVAPAVEVASSATSSSSSAPRWSPAPRPLVRAFGGLTVGLLPQAALTGGIAVGIGFSPWRAELSAYASAQQQHTTAQRPTAGGDFRLLAAGARLCRDLKEGRVIPRLCGGAEIEHITAHGFGVTDPASGGSTMGAATLAGLLVFPVARRVELSLELGAAARPYRPTFTLTNVGAVFRVPGISWGTVLSAGITL